MKYKSYTRPLFIQFRILPIELIGFRKNIDVSFAHSYKSL